MAAAFRKISLSPDTGQYRPLPEAAECGAAQWEENPHAPEGDQTNLDDKIKLFMPVSRAHAGRARSRAKSPKKAAAGAGKREVGAAH